MSFNGSGVYIEPAGQPVATGTVIQSSTFNTLVSDIGSTFNNVLPRDGQAPMNAALKLIAGTVTVPGISFSPETATGLYWPSTGNLAFTVAGSEAMRLNSGGRLLLGTTTDDGSTRLQVSGGTNVTGNLVVGGNASITGTLGVTGAFTSNSFASSGATLTGGSINNTPIGATTPSTGKFTTLQATGGSTLTTVNATSYTATTNGNALTSTMVSAAGYGGITINNESAFRKLELLFLGTGNGSAYGAAAGSAVINAASTTGLTISTNDTARIQIDGASGNVGIGTAPGAATKLSVIGGLLVGGSVTLGANSSPGIFSYEAPVFREYIGDGTGYSRTFSKRTGSVTTDLVTITDGGNLGVGLSPAAAISGVNSRIFAYGSGAQGIVAWDSAGGTNNQRIGMFADSTNNLVGFDNNFSVSTNGMVFRINATERLRIAPSIITSSSPFAVNGGNVNAIASFDSTNTAGGFLELSTSGTANGYIGTAMQVIAGGALADFGIRAQGNMSFATGGATQHMLLDMSGNLTATGGVIAAASAGFTSKTYVANSRNPIWAFDGSSSVYGLSYFQGTAGYGGSDSIGFHFGTATSAGSTLNISGTQVTVTGTMKITGVVTATNNESLRTANDSGFISFYNTANTTRNGYLQGNTGAGLQMTAESGALNLNSSGGAVGLQTAGTTRLAISNGGVITDGAGNELGYKGIPVAASWIPGQCFATTTGQTVGAANAGQTYSIFNASATAITLTQGSGLTLHQGGTANTGNRTLLPWGFATVWFQTGSVAVINGNIT